MFNTIPKDSNSSGHVGGPFSTAEYRLEDVPEMNYFAKNYEGEILIRGTVVSPGYFRNKELTDETFKNGWLYTGDIGHILESGALKIIDRKKNLFKLNQGEFIVPEKLESLYSWHPLINQIYVFGDSTKSFLVSLIFPEEENVKLWAEENKINLENQQTLQTKLKAHLLKELTALQQEYKLTGIEAIKNIHFVKSAFSEANDMMTPTMKLKRYMIRETYKAELKDMYS
jgi:long-chain acyl-CoA synthetase